MFRQLKSATLVRAFWRCTALLGAAPGTARIAAAQTSSTRLLPGCPSPRQMDTIGTCRAANASAAGGCGEPADVDRVHLGIRATIRPRSENASEVQLAIGAGKRAPGGTVAEHNACVSTGRLEERRLQREADAEPSGRP